MDEEGNNQGRDGSRAHVIAVIACSDLPRLVFLWPFLSTINVDHVAGWAERC